MVHTLKEDIGTSPSLVSRALYVTDQTVDDGQNQSSGVHLLGEKNYGVCEHNE